MEKVKLIERLSNSIYMERKLKLDKITALSKTKIRKAVGVKYTKDLLIEAKAQGLIKENGKKHKKKERLNIFGAYTLTKLKKKLI